MRIEHYRPGQRLKVYLLEVHKANRGPQVTVSRTHKNLLRRLFELEVPEIFRGSVEIKAIAREPGFRSKVAVYSRQEGIDPVGACVGLRGIRIQNIVNELNGERIDVVQWDPDPARFVANALSPAQVHGVRILPDGTTAEVVVGDRQLSLAIGKEGQNARLAAKLTGLRIDIKSLSAVEEEEATEPPLQIRPPSPTGGASRTSATCRCGPRSRQQRSSRAEGAPAEDRTPAASVTVERPRACRGGRPPRAGAVRFARRGPSARRHAGRCARGSGCSPRQARCQADGGAAPRPRDGGAGARRAGPLAARRGGARRAVGRRDRGGVGGRRWTDEDFGFFAADSER